MGVGRSVLKRLVTSLLAACLKDPPLPRRTRHWTARPARAPSPLPEGHAAGETTFSAALAPGSDAPGRGRGGGRANDHVIQGLRLPPCSGYDGPASLSCGSGRVGRSRGPGGRGGRPVARVEAHAVFPAGASTPRGEGRRKPRLAGGQV